MFNKGLGLRLVDLIGSLMILGLAIWELAKLSPFSIRFTLVWAISGLLVVAAEAWQGRFRDYDLNWTVTNRFFMAVLWPISAWITLIDFTRLLAMKSERAAR